MLGRGWTVGSPDWDFSIKQVLEKNQQFSKMELNFVGSRLY